jgi:hypothetical protein
MFMCINYKGMAAMLNSVVFLIILAYQFLSGGHSAVDNTQINGVKVVFQNKF